MKPNPRLHSAARSASLLACLVLASSACVDAEAEDDEADSLTLAQRIDALADCTPTDLQVYLTWTGPAFDPETGALLEPLPAGHVEAVVNGWANRSEDATALREEQAVLVANDVFTRDGLLGFQSVESVECDIAISHTLWRNEASMLAFVTGPAHATAMAQASTMHHASAGAHWTNDERSEAPTWREGIDRYVEELRERDG